MATVFSEAKCATRSLTHMSADVVINGTECLQLALSQKHWDLATVETARAGELAEKPCARLVSCAERSEGGLAAFVRALPTLLAEILK